MWQLTSSDWDMSGAKMEWLNANEAEAEIIVKSLNG
jgi:hypothetical protein